MTCVCADYWVDITAPSGGVGTQASPFNTIHDGINAAGATPSVANVIWVRPGTYGSATNDWNMIGGYAFTNLSIISTNGSSLTFIDNSGQHQNFLIYFAIVTINGFTMLPVTGSHAVSIGFSGYFPQVTFINCDWSNTTALGTIIALNYGSLTLNSCSFKYNPVPLVQTGSGTTLQVSATTFKYNTGLVIYNYGGVATVVNSVFIENTANYSLQSVTPALSSSYASLQINSSKIILTTSGSGTLVFYANNASLSAYGNSIFIANPAFLWDCVNERTFDMNNNDFCGSAIRVSGTCPHGFAGRPAEPDYCHVCWGANSDMNCNGVCFQTATSCGSPTTWYVSSNGTGTGTLANPFGNIQYAIGNASSTMGDKIILLPGTYNLTYSINLLGKPLNISSYDVSPQCVVITCSSSSILPAITATSMESFSRTIINGITFSGCRQVIYVGMDSGLTLNRVDITNNIGTSSKPVFDTLSSFIVMTNVIFNGNIDSIIRIINSGISPYAWLNATNLQVFATALSGGSSTRGAVTFDNAFGFITNSQFINTSLVTPSVASAAAIAFFDANYMTFTNCSFGFNNQGSSLTNGAAFSCDINTPTVTLDSATTVCGNGASSADYVSGGCSSITLTVTSSYDGCNVCNGSNLNKDCNGVCFTGIVTDGAVCGACSHP